MQRPMTVPSRTSRAGEQGRCAVALVVMRHRAGPALLHGQAGLGAVEALDLLLLVDGKHDGVSGRVDMEPDNIAQFVDELRFSGKLELLDPMRLKTMRAPDPLHRACTDPDSFRHHRSS